MIRVCHLTSVHAPFDTRIFYKECVSLTKKYEVHFIVPAKQDEYVDGVYIHHVSKDSSGRFQRMTKRVWDVYNAALKVDADVYHFHDPELIPVGILLKIRKKRVIYDIHEDVPKQIMSKEWIPQKLRLVIAKLMSFAESICDRVFDGIITVVPDIQQRFKNKNSVCIYNSPIVSEYLERPDRNKFIFGYAGGLTEIRGLHEMLTASNTTGYELFLAGKFDSKDNEKIYLWNAKNIAYKGFLCRSDMFKFYYSIDCGLVIFHPEPNHIISQPTKMKEYMEAGIPFIASNFPKWKEFVEKYKCGICVDPLDIDDIVNAMEWMVQHREEAKEMGLNGRKAIEQYFNWEIEERKLLDLYRKLLE